MSYQHDFYGIPIPVDHEKAAREASERGARTCAPAPVPTIPEEELRHALRNGPPYPPHIYEHLMRFGGTIVTNLPERAHSESEGNLPVEDASISEADKIKFAKTSPQRIDALEARIAQLESRLTRFFNEPTGGPNRI